jgi:type II secretory pathway predicted ATPase ExeA
VYREHFKLKERPFTQAPGDRFFTANAGVTDALGRLRLLLSARDCVAVVTGGPGVGKSALAEQAIGSLGSGYRVARVDLRYGEADDLFAAVLLSLGESVTAPRPVHALHALREVMQRLGRDQQRLVLALDIGGISAEIARQLLRVVNLSGEQGCQLNVILMGPHPLHQQVDVPAMIQLRQRIAFRHRVRPLTLAETDRYVRHQLEAVGADPAEVLSSNVSAAVYCYVAGVPRLINTLLDAALSEAFLQDVQRPDGNLIKRTAEGLGWKPMTPQQPADAAARPAAAPRPAPPRSAPPKVAIVASAERREARRAPEAGTAESMPAPSEMTMALRSDTLAADAARAPAVALASEGKSPTATIFGAAATESSPVPGIPAMDANDTSATGMLRLQDLDERFAETIFGKDK